MRGSDRLGRVNRELADLDAEIAGLQGDLYYSDDEEDELMTPPRAPNPPKFKGNANRDRLFQESVAVLEKRTHRIENTITDRECSDLMMPKRSIRIPNYRPPSERLDESQMKRKRFSQRARAAEERQFREECTFRPKINPESRNMRYDAGHLWRTKEPEKETPKPKQRAFIDERSRRMAERLEQSSGKGFMSRQFPEKKRAQSVRPQSQNSRRLSRSEMREVSERLSKPRPRTEAMSDDEFEVVRRRKRRSDPETFERLVNDSLRRPIPEPEPSRSVSYMDPKSRLMTLGISEDLYEQSLEIKERQRRRAEEAKKWRELSDVTRASFQPVIRTRKAPTPKKCVIAGMDDFVERMKRKQKSEDAGEPEPIRKPYTGAVVARGFSFEHRYRRTPQMIDKDVESVLSEINELLRD